MGGCAVALTYSVNETSTAFYDFNLVDENDAAIALASLSSLTITLTDDATGAVLNSRNAQNGLNANGVTVSSVGKVTWEMSPADNAIVGSPVPDGGETHTAVFRWTWASGARAATEVFKFSVTKIVRQNVDSAEEVIPMPALTGDDLVDTYNSLMVERLRVARAGPKVTYRLHGHEVLWTAYLGSLDKRIMALRREIAAAMPIEELGYGV
jgi:hypothetical protein